MKMYKKLLKAEEFSKLKKRKQKLIDCRVTPCIEALPARKSKIILSKEISKLKKKKQKLIDYRVTPCIEALPAKKSKIILSKDISKLKKKKRKLIDYRVTPCIEALPAKKSKIIPSKEFLKKDDKREMKNSSVLSNSEKLVPKKLKVVPSKQRLKLNIKFLQKLLANSKPNASQLFLDKSDDHFSNPQTFQNNISFNEAPNVTGDLNKVKKKNVKKELKSSADFPKLDKVTTSQKEVKTDDNTSEINEKAEKNKERAKNREIFQQDARERMKAAQFRMINEKLYTSTGAEAFEYFQQEDPLSYKLYHEGYRQQMSKWPVDPLDTIIQSIQKMPLKSSKVIADLGCGEARLAQVFGSKRTVHSFDLKALNDLVIECDMAKVPLKRATVDIAVFCLSLMGTNLKEYLLSAARILKLRGHLKIAEVQSRFGNLKEFVKALKFVGFKLMNKDLSSGYFVFLDFIKQKEHPKSKLPTISLNPCLYKKR